MISDYISTAVAVILPAKIITLAQACFQDASNLRYINLDNITSFAALCFLNCSNLSIKVSFSNNLINILERAFMGTNITLDGDVITCSNIIHLSAFQNNRSISNLTLNAATVFANGNCGDGTGILTINASSVKGQNNNSVNSTKYFKHIIINGPMSIDNYVYIIQGGSSLHSIRINGNITFTGSVGLFSYASASPYSPCSNFNFFEITGTISNTDANKTMFYANGDRSIGPNMIIHFAKTDEIAGNIYSVHPNYSRVSKVYVGDGSSLENDQAVLDMYLADTNWATYSSKLDCWYNYIGEYKNG